MRLLLDTHAVAWWWMNASALRVRQRELIGHPDHDVFVSAVSAWEIARKVAVGKFEEARDIPPAFDRLVERHRFRHLPLERGAAMRAAEYDIAHRDPFDRMLAAQAEIERLTLVTKDERLSAFPCATMW